MPDRRRHSRRLGLLLGAVLAALVAGRGGPALAQSVGAATSFALLGGSAVTGNGGLIDGNVGVSPGTSVTGFPPTLIAPGFGIHSADAVAQAAQTATATLYGFLVGQGPSTTLAAQLAGVTLPPGVYNFTSSADIAAGGALTLNGSGTYIFQVGSALTANVGSSIILIGGANPCSVFWQVTSAATLNGVSFAGSVVAQSGVTLGVGASLTGRALVTVGAVTMAGANLVGGCSAALPCPAITIAPALLPSASNGLPYSQQLTASGGTAPYAFTLTSGALPTGLSLSAAGLISGTPTVTGVFAFRIQATDANGCFGARDYSLAVLPPGCPAITLAPATLPNATLNVLYSQQLSASGGLAPYTFLLTSGALPAGVTLSPAGLISGIPTATGVFSFTVQATDSNGCFGARTYSLTVRTPGCPIITLLPSTLPDATRGVAYSQQFTADGAAPHTFTVTSGTLPPGLTLTPSGLLSGIPVTPGVFNFSIQATDSNGCFRNLAYTLRVQCPVIAIAPTTLPPATIGVFYSQTLSASGGTAPYVFTLLSGALPPGLTLSAAGVISGTPGAAGVFSFRVLATDIQGCSANRAYAITVSNVGCPAVSLAPPTLPAGTIGVPYSRTLTASGGTPPYAFSVVSGSLPPGLALAPSGPSTARLSGVPSTAGTFVFTIQVSDALGCIAALAYTVSIGTATPVPFLPPWALMLLLGALAAAGVARLRAPGLRPR